jgi:hypothetical protein
VVNLVYIYFLNLEFFHLVDLNFAGVMEMRSSMSGVEIKKFTGTESTNGKQNIILPQLIHLWLYSLLYKPSCLPAKARGKTFKRERSPQ